VLGLLLVLACSPDDQATDADVTTSTAPTTTAPPEPVRVVFTGDSVMDQVAAALTAALQGPLVETSFTATIAVADKPETVTGWQAALAVDPPDLVVVLVGTWEQDVVVAAQAEGAWPAPYLDRVTPFLDVLAAAGTDVLWLRYPPGAAEAAAPIAALNAAIAAMPDRFPGVSELDAGGAVAGPYGEHVRTVVDDDGVTRVVREPGVHLCPDGVVLVARRVVAELAARLDVEPNPAWEQAAWRSDPALFTDPLACLA
jgi:hypothetical protein